MRLREAATAPLSIVLLALRRLTPAVTPAPVPMNLSHRYFNSTDSIAHPVGHHPVSGYARTFAGGVAT